MPENSEFIFGTLWEKTLAQTEYAIASGALQSISTDHEIVEDGGIPFMVRILTNLARKEQVKKLQKQKKNSDGKPFNPFLPYESDLFVTNLSSTHLCLLNKFNVVDHHLLMVTREFEEQTRWLTVNDFEAILLCLAEIEGLSFYNGGKVAGASQRHKHLQLIPLTGEITNVPVEKAIKDVEFRDNIGTIPQFAFAHAICRCDPAWLSSPTEGASGMLKQYHQLLETLGISVIGDEQTAAYNLLVTRNWMMVIGRSQEKFAGISVNSLGFAGALLVKNEEKLQMLKKTRPLSILQAVAMN